MTTPDTHSNKTQASLALKVFGWIVAAVLSFVATFIILVLLGFATALGAMGLLEVTFGENVVAKYQILFGWTLLALLLSSATRLIVLFRARDRHELRWDEYIGQMFTTAVLSGGLAYGSIAVVVAAFRTLVDDLETIVDADDETLANVVLLAAGPILIAMFATILTLQKKLTEIPEPAPRDQ